METAAPTVTTKQLEELIDLVKKIFGFDFSDYTKASLKRRVSRIMMLKRIEYYDLKHLLVNDQHFFQEFLEEITVNVTEMFRDPGFYKSVQNQVMPYLSTYQHIKIWSAGCSSGEEVYSMAILLKEMGLAKKSFIYGTDINTEVLQEARKGIYSLRKIKSYAENYQLSGLHGSITDHFTILYDAATIHHELKQNTLFSVHNLISDKSFNEFQMISCRNVFIYFEIDLQERILELFYNSLTPLGFLCLGSKETIRSDKFKKKFKVINQKENIYQKLALDDNIVQRWHNSKILLLAGSAGSFKVIFDIVRRFPTGLDKTVIIVIHRKKNFLSEIEKLFSDNIRMLFREISDKDQINSKTVYIAPANYHTLIEKEGYFSLDVSDAVWYSKPSIDVTFESAADIYCEHCAAVLFSGANQDGAEGLLRLRNEGSLTIVQDPDDAEVSAMPDAAIAIKAAEYVLKTAEIMELLIK